ncbi:MAG TPA: TonB-dependent receptor [Bacteroidetes bacterium]|nr:TonB-dependent receptor [Bacteroidota bacterium]
MKASCLTHLVILLFILGFTSSVAGQDIYVSGIVRDINSHNEIAGVNIFVKNRKYGTTTDISGKYFLHLKSETGAIKITFQHVAYDPVEIPLDSLSKKQTIYMQPRIIPLQGVRVEGQSAKRFEIAKDIPQPISIIAAKTYEMRGFVDAGDLLRTDNSIQVDEELSGKKTIGIRGGNPDEVIVMYNGVKMNNTYDNVFDFSLIDLADVKRIEIIKGSNTALYGPEAFAGIVNIVPRLKQDYRIRFDQRLGSYRSGDWGLHLYQDINRFQGNFSYRRGGYKRKFLATEDIDNSLINSFSHYKANVNYELSPPKADGSANSISGLWLQTELSYDNQRDDEKLSNTNRLYSVKYSGDLFFLQNLLLSASVRQLDENQAYPAGYFRLARDIRDDAFIIRTEKSQKIGIARLLFSYEYQNNDLVFKDQKTMLHSSVNDLTLSEFHRRHHGIAAISKFDINAGTGFIQTMDFDISVRQDIIHDKQENPIVGIEDSKYSGDSYFGENNWRETTVKFSMNISGYREDLTFDSYLNFGRNVKFPTLFQQISLPYLGSDISDQPNLDVEKNNSIEIGSELTRDLHNSYAIYGWQISGNYFLNNYDNKFRSFTSPNVPIAYFDNVQTARIAGVETKSSLFLLRKKVTLELGVSKYSISEKAAFPFKSDFKATLNLILEHAGWSVLLHMFRENEQEAWLRFPDGRFAIVRLPDYSNIDFHLSKKFERFGLKYFINFSGRNLLDDDTVLQGLTIRDRRFYITMGLQY